VIQNFSGWDVNLSDSEVGSSVSATSVTNGPLSATANASINGDADIQVTRSAVFTAPVAGHYIFSIEYDLSAITNTINSDANTLDVFASPFAELQYVQQNTQGTFNPPGSFRFTDNSDVDIINLEANNQGNPFLQLNDTLVLTTTQAFNAGDSIRIDLTVHNQNMSVFNGTVVTTPIPAALPLMITSLLGLFGVAKRKSH
jgi:hypothetical protein